MTTITIIIRLLGIGKKQENGLFHKVSICNYSKRKKESLSPAALSPLGIFATILITLIVVMPMHLDCIVAPTRIPLLPLHAWADGKNSNSSTALPLSVSTIDASSGVASSSSQSSNDMAIDLTSPLTVNGIAGQFIKVKGTITNLQSTPASGIAYISIVDTVAKVPIDLEDWSASKGLYIPTIGGGQSLPLEWNIRLVRAGNYTVDILFNKEQGSDNPSLPPFASPKVVLEVAPKTNLNPGNVLPVAFGTPAVLIGILGVINYVRVRKAGTYT